MSHTTERRRLPDMRDSLTHKCSVCGVELYVTVGFWDGEGNSEDRVQPAEVFVKVSKHGDVVSGLMDGVCTMVSIALQYGVPWEVVKDKFSGMRFGAEDGENRSLLDGLARAVENILRTRRAYLDISVEKSVGGTTTREDDDEFKHPLLRGK